jgi:hypothetical protein
MKTGSTSVRRNEAAMKNYRLKKTNSSYTNCYKKSTSSTRNNPLANYQIPAYQPLSNNKPLQN